MTKPAAHPAHPKWDPGGRKGHEFLWEVPSLPGSRSHLHPQSLVSKSNPFQGKSSLTSEKLKPLETSGMKVLHYRELWHHGPSLTARSCPSLPAPSPLTCPKPSGKHWETQRGRRARSGQQADPSLQGMQLSSSGNRGTFELLLLPANKRWC